jgi:hypothetical protein
MAVHMTRVPALAALLLAFLWLVPSTGAEAQTVPVTVLSFPDHLKLRSEFLSSVVTAAPSRALDFKPVFRDTASGRVRISVERDGASFYVMFLRERDGEYPYGSRGNVIVKRDTKTGYMTRVLWYLGDDEQSWISLVPRNERTIVDFVVAGVAVREGYAVSRLVYQLFTNSFGALYETTRAGLDWSLVFGEPGPASAVRLAAQIKANQRYGAARALLEAASDFTTVGRYLSEAGAGESEPVEVTTIKYPRFLKPGNPRDPALATAPKYVAEHGLPLEAVPGVLLAGARDKAAYVALVEGVRGFPSAKLALIPYFDAAGSYAYIAAESGTGALLDIAELLRSRPGAFLRMFRLPLPDVSP